MLDLDKIDVRVAHRYIQKDLLAQADFDKYLAELPDLSDQVDVRDYETIFREEAIIERQRAAERPKPAPIPVKAAPPTDDEDEDDDDLDDDDDDDDGDDV